jgi:hypothetical protein
MARFPQTLQERWGSAIEQHVGCCKPDCTTAAGIKTSMTRQARRRGSSRHASAAPRHGQVRERGDRVAFRHL